MMREADGIYQNDKLVARVRTPEVKEQDKQVHFAEVYDSDFLSLLDECEFGKYTLIVRTIDTATKVGANHEAAPRKLTDVTAEIVSYREH